MALRHPIELHEFRHVLPQIELLFGEAPTKLSETFSDECRGQSLPDRGTDRFREGPDGMYLRSTPNAPDFARGRDGN